MATPSEEEYFTEWTKPFPRDVTDFGVKSADLRTITYNTPFYLYGIKFDIMASCVEFWEALYHANSFAKTFTKTFAFDIEMFFENGDMETKRFYITSHGKEVPHKAFVKTGKKIKKIKIKGGVKEISIRKVLGGYESKLVWNGKKYVTIDEPWYYTVRKYTEAEIKNLKLYEHPCIDSGMRIAGANGKIYAPAETAFPSPLRIFHKKIRNIMLVPLGCDYASVFKIKTKNGIQAITTLID